MKIKGEHSININGVEYFTVKQLARLTNKEEANIRRLIGEGNRVRKMESKKLCGKPFIPVEELFEFPFVYPGRGNEKGILAEMFVFKDGILKSVEKLIEV